MISKFKEINLLFEEIDRHLENEAHFFIIGGAMLLYHGIKPSTKDLDIIIETIKEFTAVENALKKINFKVKLPTRDYKNMDLNQIFVREDFRIDLFQRTVCRGFALSKTMKQRAMKIIELKHLQVFLCSYEDVFLFKTLTEREGDLEDCIAIAQRGIDWNAVLEELKTQIDDSKNKVWITLVGERLDLLEEQNLAIPIMKKVNKLRRDYFKEYEKRKSIS